MGGGSDTWQNVETVLPQLKTHHITTVITVTDPFHEYRAMAIASAQGLIPYPVTRSQLSDDQVRAVALLPQRDPGGRRRAHRRLRPTEFVDDDATEHHVSSGT